MSQSPESEDRGEAAALSSYQRGWRRLNDMLTRGGSLSGRERNCCFLNLGTTSPLGRFADISAVSGFDFEDDGRGLAAVDWDRDGDLDIWVTNRTSPRVRFLRNDSDNNYHFLRISLEGVECNRDAIGARVELELKGLPNRKLVRTLTAGDSFLSQSSKWLHFGLGSHSAIEKLSVRWPGAAEAEWIHGVSADQHYRIRQGAGRAEAVQVQTAASLAVAQPDVDVARESTRTGNGPTARTVVVSRIPFPPIDVHGPNAASDSEPVFRGRPLLIALWDSSCPPCLDELREFERRRSDLLRRAVDIVALTPRSSDKKSDAKVREQIKRIGFSFRWGYAEPGDLDLVEAFLGFVNAYRRPLSVPLSVLLDGHGQVTVVYRGPLEVERLLQDVELLSAPSDELREHVSEFSGKWFHPVANRSPLRFAALLKEEGDVARAESYLKHLVSMAQGPDAESRALSEPWIGDAAFALGSILAEQGRYDESIPANRVAAEHLPEDYRPHANIGSALLILGDERSAIEHLTLSLEISPDRETVLMNRANAYLRLNDVINALRDFESVLRKHPQNSTARQSAAALCFRQGADRRAVDHYRQFLDTQPNSVDAMGALAWILATSNDDDVRDGKTAVELARTWCLHTNNKDPRALNALAAAYAEQGEFETAVRTIQLAIRLASSQNPALVQSYESRLDQYRKGQPYRRGRRQP